MKEKVEGSENALRELERLMKNINIVKTEYEQLRKERVPKALSRAEELMAQLDRYERALESVAQKHCWSAGLGALVKALEAAYSRGSGSEAGELLEVLKAVGELEKILEPAGAGRAGGSLRADGLKVIRELVKEAVYRLSTGEDPSALLGEALSVAKALQELEALAEKGARIVSLEDLEVVGYVEGKPVYSLKPRNRPDR